MFHFGGVLISFVIITNGLRLAKTQREIDSITAQAAGAEIVVSGSLPIGLEGYNKFSNAQDAAKRGLLGAMRNAGCQAASGDVLVVADDDMVFHPGFIDGIRQYGDFDALACRMLNPDGTRYWDWTIRDPKRGQYLIPYDQDDPYTYITGGLIVLRRAVWEAVRWDDTIGFQQAEDVDYTERLRKAGYRIGFNANSTATHNDSRYTQVDKWVVKRG